MSCLELHDRNMNCVVCYTNAHLWKSSFSNRHKKTDCFYVCTSVIVMPLLLYGSLLISGSLATIIRTTVLIFVFIAQYTILKNTNPGHRNWIEILGVTCVIFGTIFTSLAETFKDCVKGKKGGKRRLSQHWYKPQCYNNCILLCNCFNKMQIKIQVLLWTNLLIMLYNILCDK